MKLTPLHSDEPFYVLIDLRAHRPREMDVRD